MISLQIDWFDLAVQGTFRSLLQHCSSKASLLWHSAFFTAQLTNVTSGKTIAMTVRTFVSILMPLLFKTLSRFVMGFPGESVVKNLPARHETQDRSLGQEDPLEKEMATKLQYSCLENPIDGEAWWATVHGLKRVGPD